MKTVATLVIADVRWTVASARVGVFSDAPTDARGYLYGSRSIDADILGIAYARNNITERTAVDRESHFDIVVPHHDPTAWSQSAVVQNEFLQWTFYFKQLILCLYILHIFFETINSNSTWTCTFYKWTYEVGFYFILFNLNSCHLERCFNEHSIIQFFNGHVFLHFILFSNIKFIF